MLKQYYSLEQHLETEICRQTSKSKIIDEKNFKQRMMDCMAAEPSKAVRMLSTYMLILRKLDKKKKKVK